MPWPMGATHFRLRGYSTKHPGHEKPQYVANNNGKLALLQQPTKPNCPLVTAESSPGTIRGIGSVLDSPPPAWTTIDPLDLFFSLDRLAPFGNPRVSRAGARDPSFSPSLRPSDDRSFRLPVQSSNWYAPSRSPFFASSPPFPPS